jgi:hypothetical protein
MTPAYHLIARRDPDRADGLKIGYPTKEHAIAAVDIIRHLWAVITVTAPDGSLVLHLESPQTQTHQLRH